MVRAQGTDTPGGKGAQQGLLDLGRGVAHLVQHQGAAFGGQKSPLARLFGFGERALDVSEQGIHEQGLVQRAAVDGDKRPVGTVAQAVDGFGDQLLAGARLAHDQHVRQNLGSFLNLAVEGLHGQGGAHQAAGRQIRRIGQIRHGLPLLLGRLFLCLGDLIGLGPAQPAEQDVHVPFDSFQFQRQGGQTERVGAVQLVAGAQFAGKPVQALARAVGQPPEAQAQQQRAAQETQGINAQ